MSSPTWSDLNSPSIVPPFGSRQAPDIGPVAVMVSCEPDFRLIRSTRKIKKSHAFFISTLMELAAPHEGISIAGPFIGAPYGAMLMESLIAKGGKKVIMLGWCGAVKEGLEAGDLIIAEGAIVDEGTSANYRQLDKEPPVSCPSKELSESFSGFLTQQGIAYKRQTIWTTDAIYRETRSKVNYFKDLGAGVVEMECSALFSVAHFHGIEICALLVVSDSVVTKNWTPGFGKKRFKTARHTACEAVIQFAGELIVNG